jgi:hypothetical protein
MRNSFEEKVLDQRDLWSQFAKAKEFGMSYLVCFNFKKQKILFPIILLWKIKFHIKEKFT